MILGKKIFTRTKASREAVSSRSYAPLYYRLRRLITRGTKIADSCTGTPAAKIHEPFEPLAYYLIHKLRILHGRTHVGRVVADGRAISPDLALTAGADLVEVLRSAGPVKTP